MRWKHEFNGYIHKWHKDNYMIAGSWDGEKFLYEIYRIRPFRYLVPKIYKSVRRAKRHADYLIKLDKYPKSIYELGA